MEDWDVDKLLGSYDYNVEDVLYVIYQNQRCSWLHFKTSIAAYDHSQFDNDYLNYQEAFYNTTIVGEDWWINYYSQCCSGPAWCYHKHPGK